MKKMVVILVLLGVCLSASAFSEELNSAVTSGLTTVTYTSTKVQKAATWYQCIEWTVENNTNNALPLVDLDGTPFTVLVDKLFVFNTGIPTLWETPDSSWTYDPQGGYERFADSPSKKMWAPPSIAPGGALSGFKLYFALPSESASYVMPSAYAPMTHVMAVVPNTSAAIPLKYTGLQVTLDWLNGDTNAKPTWHDAPDDGGGNPQEEVPEFSSLALAALGLVGPAGYAARRRRA